MHILCSILLVIWAFAVAHFYGVAPGVELLAIVAVLLGLIRFLTRPRQAG